MKMTKKGIMNTVITMAAILLVACGANTSKETSSAEQSTSPVLNQIKEKGTLVIGTSADYPPFEWHLVKDGKDTVVGYDIDISNAIAEKLGVKLEVKEMEFGSLVAAVKTGKIDMAIAGMNPTEERAKEVDFSKVYYETDIIAVIRKSDASKYTTFESLDGAKVGAQKGTVQEEIAIKNLPKAEVISQPKNNTLILALQQNKVDAVVMDKVVAEEFIKGDDTLMVAPFATPAEKSGSAVAVQKNNEAFLAEIQAVLDELASSGQLDKFMVKNTELMSEQ